MCGWKKRGTHVCGGGVRHVWANVDICLTDMSYGTRAAPAEGRDDLWTRDWSHQRFNIHGHVYACVRIPAGSGGVFDADERVVPDVRHKTFFSTICTQRKMAGNIQSSHVPGHMFYAPSTDRTWEPDSERFNNVKIQFTVKYFLRSLLQKRNWGERWIFHVEYTLLLIPTALRFFFSRNLRNKSRLSSGNYRCEIFEGKSLCRRKERKNLC